MCDVRRRDRRVLGTGREADETLRRALLQCGGDQHATKAAVFRVPARVGAVESDRGVALDWTAWGVEKDRAWVPVVREGKAPQIIVLAILGHMEICDVGGGIARVLIVHIAWQWWRDAANRALVRIDRRRRLAAVERMRHRGRREEESAAVVAAVSQMCAVEQHRGASELRTSQWPQRVRDNLGVVSEGKLIGRVLLPVQR